MTQRIPHISSYFLDKHIENSSSVHNPTLQVLVRNGKYILNAGRANYSFGALHQVFQQVFNDLKIKLEKPKSVLILGFGAGSVASILLEELDLNCTITGVEIDVKVLELESKHFRIVKNRGIEIHNLSAENFLSNCQQKYDMVVVDIFLDLIVPPQIQTATFIEDLKKVTNPNGKVIFNFVVNSKVTLKQFTSVNEKFKSVFADVKTINALDSNRVLVAQNRII